ncbi:nuclear pore complex protein Nup214-like isoform X3 [Stylophora pistillata]|nr:nuclear pore complex protein Nup214-like isoform X3 [Stylophora pistillata]
MRKIRMFESPKTLPTARSSLVAVSTKYGLTFVGCPTGIKVIKTETIERINESDEGSMQNVVAHCPSTFEEIGHPVQLMGLSNDDLTLSVCYVKKNQTVMNLYDVPTLGSSNTSNAKFAEEILTGDTVPYSSAEGSVENLLWNPGFPGILAICFSSGSVFIMELTETEIKILASLPESVNANAICWSPKGKQLVVGHRDGSLTQYSQALEVKKEIECPEIFLDDPHSVTDVLWITATLFAVVYSSFEEGDAPKFQLISTPKNEPKQVINFDDIYYVMSDERQPMFYLKLISEWNMLISACSNGFEAAVLGKYGGEASTPWEKWNVEETGRAEMPLTNNNDETFPMGLALDFRSKKPILEGEKQLPPAPMMMLLSTDGVLCPYYVVNQTPNTDHGIIKLPEPLPLGGQRKTIASNAGSVLKGSVSSTSGTSGDLPSGVFSQTSTSGFFSTGPSSAISSPGSFSFSSTKQSTSLPSVTEASGKSSNSAAVTFSFAGSKQSSSFTLGTPTSVKSGYPTTSTFLLGTPSPGTPGNLPTSNLSFPGPMQTAPLASGVPSSGMSGNPAASAFLFSRAFSLTSDKQAGPIAFKPASQSQVQATESGKPSGNKPPLVKPTPTTQMQPGSLLKPSFQPSPTTTAVSAKLPSHTEVPELGSPSASQSFKFPGQSNVRESAKQEPAKKVPGVGLSSKPKLTPAKQPAGHVTKEDQPSPSTSRQEERIESSSHFTANSPSLSQSFKLPGQSNARQSAKQEPGKKVAPFAKGNTIDASVSETIQETISLFNEEMAKLGSSVKSMQAKCRLTDDDKELASFRKETSEVGRSLKDIKDTTKVQQNDIDEEKRKLLEAFEILEDIRIRQEKKNDPRYIQLLKSRALDPLNKKKMKEIRQLHLYLDKTLRDVIMVLDEQWNKENRQKRSIQHPALADIYQALRMHRKIAQDQGVKLDKIEQEMKNRKPVSTSWLRNSINTTSLRDDVSSLSEPFSLSKQGLKSPTKPVAAPISPEKRAKLRNMFQKRGNTPVRRSMIDFQMVTKTPLEKPAKPEMPFYSSTPALERGEAAERSKGGFKLLGVSEEQDDESPSEEESEDDDTSEEQELNQWNEVQETHSRAPDSQPVQSTAEVTSKSGFSLGISQERNELNEPAPQKTRISTVVNNLQQARDSPKAAASGTFSAVDKSSDGGIKASESQTIQAESVKPTNGFNLPSIKGESSPGPIVQPKGDLKPGVKVISTETPPNVAAAMAAMSRASASQGAVQSSSNLEPSASIEPVTLVTYRPQSQGSAPAKDYDAGNTAAKAIANAALMAATAEAQKSSTKPQYSTEFVFKSTDSSKPGPPVVTFKPPASPPKITESGTKFSAAPNVSVNPSGVFKPAFPPPVPTSSTTSSTGGLQQPLSRTQATSGFSFAPPPGGLFNVGASSGTAVPAFSAFSFSSKAKDTADAKASSLAAAASVESPKPVTNSSTPTVGITPSARVSRNLFAAGNAGNEGEQTVPTRGEQELKQETRKDEGKTVQVTTTASSVTTSKGIVNTGTAAGFSISATTPFGVNFSSSDRASSVFGSSDTGGGSTSILNNLLRTSTAGGIVASGDAAATASALPGQVSLPSKGTPSENKDTTTAPTATSVTPAPEGVFSFSLGGNKTATISAPSVFGAPTTTGTTATSVTPAPGDVFGLSLGGNKTATTSAPSVFGAPTTTGTTATSVTPAPGDVFGLSLGGNKTATTSAPSVFGAPTTTGTTATSVTPAPGDVFGLSLGGNKTATTSAPSVFGAPTTTGTTATSVTPTPGGVFGLSLGGNKTATTSTPSVFGAPSTTATTATSVTPAPGNGFSFSVGGNKTAMTSAPSVTPTGGSAFRFPSGSASSAFSVTSSASSFFPSITSTSKSTLSSLVSSSLTTFTTPKSTVVVASSSPYFSTSMATTGGLFGKITSTESAFGAVSSTGSSVAGSLGSTSTTTATGNVFGRSTSTAFAPTPVFGASSGSTFASTSPAFGIPVSSQGSVFGSTPVFGSQSSAASTGSGTGFGASITGQSPFASTTTYGFGTASKPTENALGFGFGRFGLGGQASPQTSKTNPFGVTQGIQAPTSTQSSLFGGKSGADVFKTSDALKPTFGFGAQSSGGFSSGSFSASGTGVGAGGFGFGAASPSASSGFGTAQPFGSPSAVGSVFGGAPAFGSAPVLGGAPAFGGSPQGGLGTSPTGGVFGSVNSGGFGQAQGSPTFGALAGQSNVPSFGAVAGMPASQGFGGMQQPQQTCPAFGSFGGGSQSPGGASFSQWR